jgi:hypothetical protein
MTSTRKVRHVPGLNNNMRSSLAMGVNKSVRWSKKLLLWEYDEVN